MSQNALADVLKEETPSDVSPSNLNIDDLNIQDIITLIPHRYPFLLIDRIEDIEIGMSAVGVKNVSMNEWYFQGHFPDHPIMPGVLIIEALAQTAAALVVKSMKVINQTNAITTLGANELPMVYFMSVDNAKFRKPVLPGDVLRLKVIKERSHGSVWKFKGNAYVGNTLVSEASFTAMIVDQQK